ncbi:hypothetical protein [Piscinibacter sakaiensis]|uniref:hypothetical protein n=1 Tax=Piscinibacter sakaiensis TaxID=1547922 RepID=UPI003AAEAAF8
MTLRGCWLPGALLLASAGLSAAPCPPPDPLATVVEADQTRIAWRVESAPIAVAQPFVLLIDVCPAESVLRRIDATMPEHRHGMNYRPLLQPLGNGRWRVEGLMWHMPGRWEMVFDLRAGGRDVQLRDSVLLR